MTSGRERTVSFRVSSSGNKYSTIGHQWTIELREYGPESEREAATVECVYTGARSLFFRGGLGMVDLRFSRKFTTLGGKIGTEPRKSWSELDRHVWHGRT
jgi:hypothetical protein